MWICLNDAFFSVIASDKNQELLAIRSRREGDIERYFPGFEVFAWPGRDYAFRAFIPRQIVAHTIASALEDISYYNFKDSVQDERLHEAYADVWGVMHTLQRSLRRQ